MKKETLILLGVLSQVMGAVVAVWAYTEYRGGRWK